MNKKILSDASLFEWDEPTYNKTVKESVNTDNDIICVFEIVNYKGLCETVGSEIAKDFNKRSLWQLSDLRLYADKTVFNRVCINQKNGKNLKEGTTDVDYSNILKALNRLPEFRIVISQNHDGRAYYISTVANLERDLRGKVRNLSEEDFTKNLNSAICKLLNKDLQHSSGYGSAHRTENDWLSNGVVGINYGTVDPMSLI